VSKTDFDERLVLEVRKLEGGSFGTPEGSSVTRRADQPEPASREAGGWHDYNTSGIYGAAVASRVNMGIRTNPFLSILLGIEKVGFPL